jgi:hypothetical protein
MKRRRLTTLVLVATAVASGGCSFLFVEPSVRKPLSPETCTEVPIAPVVDAVLTGVSAAAAVSYAGSAEDAARGFGADKENAVATAVMSGLLFGASAVTGFYRVNDCREAKSPPGVTTARR